MKDGFYFIGKKKFIVNAHTSEAEKKRIKTLLDSANDNNKEISNDNDSSLSKSDKPKRTRKRKS